MKERERRETERETERESERGIHDITVRYHNCYFEPLYIDCSWESS